MLAGSLAVTPLAALARPASGRVTSQTAMNAGIKNYHNRRVNEPHDLSILKWPDRI
jgi:hypothetical protein